VILCTNPNDQCALRINPSCSDEVYVWIAKAVTEVIVIQTGKDKGKAKFKGWFYYNKEKDITRSIRPKKNHETIVIAEDSIVKVFAAEDDVEFELSNENIQEIRARF
jgi:hypothetical protein